MIVLAAVIGAAIGIVLSGLPGFVTGALLGYGIASIHSLQRRIARLEGDIRETARQAHSMPGDTIPVQADGASVSEVESDAAGATGDRLLHVEETDAATPPETGPDTPIWTPQWTAGQEKPSYETVDEKRLPPAEKEFLRETKKLAGRFLSGGSLLVKMGVIVLFFGVSFLVKYAAEHSLFPIELRLISAALAGAALLGIGVRVRAGRPLYSHVLQGGGIGILYITTFAAYRLYELIPSSFAFFVLVAVAVLSAFLAIIQDSLPLAALGATGGFLAPILASTGAGSHVALFSYYTLLNLGIAAIAWFRTWRILNLLGFTFTLGIGAAWGWRYYSPEHFATTEPFLIIFFLIYTFIAVIFALRQPPELKGYLDGAIVFGTPVAAFALQSLLVQPYHFGLAWSALALGLFYLPLAWILFSARPVFMKTVAEAFFAFGVIFATLAIPFALDNRWTSAVWALEGAAILWAGLRQRRRLARAFGVLLQLGSGIAFLADSLVTDGATPILNGFFLGCALLAITGVFSAYSLNRHEDEVTGIEKATGRLMLAWGLLWWFAGGLREIDLHGATGFRSGIVLGFLSVSCLICDQLERRLSWRAMAIPALSLLPMLICGEIFMYTQDLNPLAEGGLVAWPASFVAYYFILYRHEELETDILPLLHAATLWLLTVLASLELAYKLELWVSGANVWRLIAFGVVPGGAALLLTSLGMRLSWPIGKRRETYLSLGIGPVAIFAFLWFWFANIASDGNAAPLSYLPFINPLDLTIGCIMVALYTWLHRLRATMPDIISRHNIRKPASTLMAVALFAWLNGILVRSVHHWKKVPFTPSDLFDSVFLQTSLSLLWSLLSLCAMIIATRKGSRTVWLSGAGLMAAVVLKLFLVDLSGSGTVSRIVSFVVVGILLLVIGYFAPVPPRGHNEEIS